MSRYVDRLVHAKTRRRWRRLADAAELADLSDLRQQRNQARKLCAELDRLIHVADGRLALPKLGSSSFPRPHGTDWAWRPQLWCGPLPRPGLSSAPSEAMLGDEVQVFHDCTAWELTLRQLRNTRPQDLAPFALRLDVFRFDGSFLSLAIDLPPDSAEGLCRDHILRAETILEIETPLEIYARLNIQNGPNTEQIIRKLPLLDETVRVDFDMADTRINEKRIEKIWLDLIFGTPTMNQVILRDLTFARHRRAAL
ncbi:DUF6478 family protein [Sedimentitalea todarodis]|uniref:DUF6478 family protein n=1 Tax=Sedimentitalea todarodis TaxID=1631240 RepID=A0ABU3V9Y4_9RHOB|nr:DUF6478 family protein [Sedimentitalea todarodis]MDU9002957.1 DUF6478 family protein [Sedimentitalea todarodis]